MSELQIREKLDCLPDKPGVYLLKDEKGKTIIAAVVSSISKKPQDYKILALMKTNL